MLQKWQLNLKRMLKTMGLHIIFESRIGCHQAFAKLLIDVQLS